MKLRVARATSDLARIARMYREGLEFDELASFRDHAGFDGIVLGCPGAAYHLEFTTDGAPAPRSASPEDLLVFYVGQEFAPACARMLAAGFRVVDAHNPYWDANGRTFEDHEGYRVVLCRSEWSA